VIPEMRSRELVCHGHFGIWNVAWLGFDCALSWTAQNGLFSWQVVAYCCRIAQVWASALVRKEYFAIACLSLDRRGAMMLYFLR
jgi:hypothetical protein